MAQGGLINASPRLCVSLLCNETLRTAAEEVDYLERNKSIVDTYGPWPQNKDLAQYAAIDHLLDSKNGLFGVSRDAWVDLLHLACHTNTTGLVNDHYLNVGGGEYGRIRLGDLKQRRAQNLSTPRIPRPLVFLNACASAEVQADDRATFTKFFLDNEYLGVLGTLCDISGPVAAHFANVFYEHLLRRVPADKVTSVGQAMYKARRHLLEVHRNPMGLLYSYYGNPDLRVEPGHDGDLAPACECRSADESGTPVNG